MGRPSQDIPGPWASQRCEVTWPANLKHLTLPEDLDSKTLTTLSACGLHSLTCRDLKQLGGFMVNDGGELMIHGEGWRCVDD